MNYPEMKINQYDVPYRYLETIGTREYWQVSNTVSSAKTGAKRWSEGTVHESWPVETQKECLFADWDVYRTYLLRLVDIHPQETKHRCMTLKKDWSGAKTITGAFYSVADMMNKPQLEDLFVLVEEYDSENDDCYLWSGCGTDLLFQCMKLPKHDFRTLSEENIRWFTDFMKQLNADSVAQRIIHSLEKDGAFFLVRMAFHWLRTIGYDMSEIDKKRDENCIRNEERRKREQEVERLNNEAAEAKRQEEKAESLRIIREGIVQDKKLVLKDLPYGHEVLVSLFKSEGLELPLRTKGWIEKLWSVTVDSYSWRSKSRRKQGVKKRSVFYSANSRKS